MSRTRECLELVHEINTLYSTALATVGAMVDRLQRVREICQDVTGEGVMDVLLTDDALQKFVGRERPGA